MRLGRILGIPIGVNWSIVGVAVLFTASLALQALPLYAPEAGLRIRLVVASIAILAFFGSILAHELGHAVVALAHGVGVDGITLWLLGGVAQLDRQAPTARAELQIAAAGPAVSFILGVFFAAVAVITNAVTPGRLLIGAIVWLAGVNLVLAVFNLLPAAPLDGGRVLTALLWQRMGDADSGRIIAGRCGLFLGVGLIAAGVGQVFIFDQLGGWITTLIGAFVFNAARQEISSAAIRRRLLATVAADVLVPHPTPVPDTITIRQLVDWAGPAGRITAYPVVRWGPEPIGWVVPATASDLAVEEQAWTSVRELMRSPDRAIEVDADAPLDDLLRRWEGADDQIAVVHAPGGHQVVGTITGGQLQPLLRQPDLWGRDRSDRPTLRLKALTSPTID